jgi:hypothetical protein
VPTFILQLLSSGQTGKAWEPSNEIGVLADIGKQEEKTYFVIFQMFKTTPFLHDLVNAE